VEVVVRLTFWGVGTRAVPLAVARMSVDRLHLRRAPGLRFAKLLGTGDGRTFTLRDADPLHWGLLTVWNSDEEADRFAAGTTYRRWDALARERLDVRMRPTSSRGRWSRKEPFGRPVPTRIRGQAASITRGRIRPSRMREFWRSVPAVSADLHRVPGMRLAVGIGEAPVGLQGTFTIWDDEAALREFAHRRAPHLDVVRRSRDGWFAEELFARLAVERVDGTFAGIHPGLRTTQRPAVSTDDTTRATSSAQHPAGAS
jgi:hypothetical protein